MKCIYKIVNKKGEVYVGATVDYVRRRREHNSRKHGHKGTMSVLMELSDSCTLEEMNECEEFYYFKFKKEGFVLLNQTKPGNKQRHSEQTRKKMSKAKKGKPRDKEAVKSTVAKLKKPILAYDKEGNLIKEFSSIKEAAEKLNLHASNICNCLNGTNKYSGNCSFKYKYIVNG